MKPKRPVALWDATATISYAELFNSERITDVFFRDNRPAAGTVMLGILMEDFPREGGPWIAVCGIATSGQPVATGKDRVTIQHLRGFGFYPLSTLRNAIHELRLDRDPAPLEARNLSSGVSERVLAFLSQEMPGFEGWLNSLAYSGAPIPKPDGLRIREERDAVSLAFNLSEMEAPSGALLTSATEIDFREPLAGVFAPRSLKTQKTIYSQRTCAGSTPRER